MLPVRVLTHKDIDSEQGDSETDGQGGGIYIINSSVIITNTHIENNKSWDDAKLNHRMAGN